MKFAIGILTVLLFVLGPYIPGPYMPQVYAEQLSYSQIIEEFINYAHPKQPHTFEIGKIEKFQTEQNDAPSDSLAMWLTVHIGAKKIQYIILVGGGHVYGYKPIDGTLESPKSTQPQQDEGPSCSEEEMKQHHGKDSKEQASADIEKPIGQEFDLPDGTSFLWKTFIRCPEEILHQMGRVVE